MPTEKKAALIEDLKECITDCSIAIATDYAGTVSYTHLTLPTKA